MPGKIKSGCPSSDSHFVYGHKTQKTFRDYIKLSSDEIAGETDAIINGKKDEVF